MAFDIEMIEKVYANMVARVDKARELVGKPLTLTEKILYSHLWDETSTNVYKRGFTEAEIVSIYNAQKGRFGL